MKQQNRPDCDSIRQTHIYGVEYWSARDLMPLLGYDKWERFEGAIKRAMVSCENMGNSIEAHFPGSGKTSPMPYRGVKAAKKLKTTEQDQPKDHSQDTLF